MLDVDRVKIICRVNPLDFQQQQSFAQAVAAGVLNPQDPRVVRKALELYQLPDELSSVADQQKKQWREIEQMKAGQWQQPVAFRDDDDTHGSVCQAWLISDEADKLQASNPQVVAMIYHHLLMHVANKAKVMEAAAIVQGPAAAQGQPGQPEQGGQGGQSKPNPNNNQDFRQARAQKGGQAKPSRPQPPGGNQNNVGRQGTSKSSMQRRNRA
jgi:hypothetical protein